MINFIFINTIITIIIYLILILISFHPEDPGWLQDKWNESIYNFGGLFGARISDFLFFMFGIVTILIPIFILFYLCKFFVRRTKITIFLVFFGFMKILIILFMLCVLMHIFCNDFFYFPSGGIVGYILYDWIFHFGSFDFYIPNILLYIGIINVISLIFPFSDKKIKILMQKIFKYINTYCYSLYNFQKLCNKLHTYLRVFIKNKYYFLLYLRNLFKKLHCFFISTKHNINNFFYFQNIWNITYYVIMIITIWKHTFIKTSNIFFKKIINYILFKKYIKNNLKKNPLTKYDSIQYQHLTNFINGSSYSSCDNINFDLIKKDYYPIPNFLEKKIYHQSNYVQNNDALQSYKNINPTTILTSTNCTSKKLKFNYEKNKSKIFPSLDLLQYSSTPNVKNSLKLQEISHMLELKLSEYNISVKVKNIIVGPVITRFDLALSPGIKSSKIVNLSRDLARSLSVTYVRVIEVVPHTSYVGLEVPNKERDMVYLRDIIGSDEFQKIKTPLALVLGKDISGKPIIQDLRHMPHLLVAGTTGSGKSIGINSMIVSMLYKATPKEVRFIMIDPKILELSIYSNIPHMLKPVITNLKEVNIMLQWCVDEMERRYQQMAIVKVRNLEQYNYYIDQLSFDKNNCSNLDLKKLCMNDKNIINLFHKLPYIVIIIDEFSDLMFATNKKVEELIIRLTQKSRAAGIHLILSTQRPSVDVITGLIKSNIPARIAFTVSSKIDSYTILGQSGAESLLGMGDMLYLSSCSSFLVRIHGAFICDKEIEQVVRFWNS